MAKNIAESALKVVGKNVGEIIDNVNIPHISKNARLYADDLLPGEKILKNAAKSSDDIYKIDRIANEGKLNDIIPDDVLPGENILKGSKIAPETINSELKSNLFIDNSTIPSEIPSPITNTQLKGDKLELPTSTSKADSHKNLKGRAYGSKDGYMKYKASKNIEDGFKALKNKDYNNEVIQSAAKKIGIDAQNMTAEHLSSYRDLMIGGASAKDMTVADHMGYYKVPQKVTGVIGTAWLVNKLASTKGQQSNAQLYNQNQQY